MWKIALEREHLAGRQIDRLLSGPEVNASAQGVDRNAAFRAMVDEPATGRHDNKYHTKISILRQRFCRVPRLPAAF